MGDETFDEATLTEKLSKLNSSQQSIESLSKWCVTHRKKANQVVENWDKVFKAAERAQQVSLLYLANDILQNSRRKGSEFVNEFWKVLPPALKGAYDSGHQSCRKVVLRLVNIWEERKVFGSRGHNLKYKIQGEKPSPGKNPSPVNNVRKSNPIKIVKKDADSLRIKLDVGGLPEKILTAFQLVFDESLTEEGAFTKCKEAVSSIQELQKDVAKASSQGNPAASDVVEDIQKQENMLQQCINQLENSEAIRAALVSHLKEALSDQESKLERIRNELLVARGRVEHAANTRNQLTPSSTPTTNLPATMHTFPPGFSPHNPALTQSTHLSTSSSNEEATTKASAAAMAAKLTSSTSSAQMLSSILSSFLSDPESSSSAYFSTSQQSVTSLPPVSTNQSQAQFLPPPPPPPLPPLPANTPRYQVSANSPGYQVGMQYNYAGANLPRQYPPAQQAGPGNGGYYRPVGPGFYGQTHQPSTSPIDRQ